MRIIYVFDAAKFGKPFLITAMETVRKKLKRN